MELAAPVAGRVTSIGVIPEPATESDHVVTVSRCLFQRKRLVVDGPSMALNIKEAVALMAPSKTRLARTNVLRLKVGQFIGVKSGDLSNFVIMNPTGDGDVRWLLKKYPELPSQVRDIYLVESVTIRRNSIDLPMENDNGD